MWGMITTGNFNDSTIRSSLKGLQKLGALNPTGWGIGFYTQTVKGYEIPVIHRGMWRADLDWHFDTIADLLANNIFKSGLAHVRNASSGYTNIPGPHPFYTKSLTRNFDMMFAHNGTLDVSLLQEQLGSYTDYNHYGYARNNNLNEPNLDSDLYRLYLMKWIDEHPTDHITKCLVKGMTSLIDTIGENYLYNFILASKGDTMWALRFNASLYYRYNDNPSGKTWEVASEPIGENNGWIEANDHCLYVFTPNQPTPTSYCLPDTTMHAPENINLKGFNCTLNNKVLIGEFFGEEGQHVLIKLFNINGQLIDNIYNNKAGNGITRFTYNMGNLSSGIYFIQKHTNSTADIVRKIIKE
jgi:predicted glutamine amidotransferase